MTNHPTDSYSDAFFEETVVEEEGEPEEDDEPLVIEHDFGGLREE